MTDKRPGNGFNYIQPRRKIPKLDVSIVTGSSQSGRSSISRGGSSAIGHNNVYPPPQRPPTHPNHHHHQAMRPPPARAPPPQPPPSSEDMWGDDDDDFIISQAAEKAENCNPQQLLNALDASTTFGDFQRNHRAATSASTQLPQAAAVAAVAAPDELTDDAVLREFRSSMGGEDDVFSEVPDFDQIDDVNKHINEYLNNDQNTLVQQQQLNNFSGGSAGSAERSGGTAGASKLGNGGTATGPARQTSGGGSSSDGGPIGASAHNKYMQNVENAREIRLKFLSAQLADRQRENEQLQREVTKLNERCQTKDGEVSACDGGRCGREFVNDLPFRSR